MKELSYEQLRYYYDTTVGLYCIDQNPNEVDLEWIRKNAFQLEPIDGNSKIPYSKTQL